MIQKLQSLMESHAFVAPILILGAYIVNSIFTYSSLAGIYGCTNSEISRDNYTLISPPGWAFSIWSVIFIWEGLSCVYCCLPCFKDASHRRAIAGQAPWVVGWVITCLLQSVWSILICQSIYAAAAVLILEFLSLWFMQQFALRSLFHHTSESDGSSMLAHLIKGYFLLVAPFSIHLGWVLVASTLNVNLSLVHRPHLHSAATCLAGAVGGLLWVAAVAWSNGVVGTPMTSSSSDGAFVGAVVWALSSIATGYQVKDGIYVSSTSTDPNHDPATPYIFPADTTNAIKHAAGFAAGMLTVGFVLGFVIRRVVSLFGLGSGSGGQLFTVVDHQHVGGLSATNRANDDVYMMTLHDNDKKEEKVPPTTPLAEPLTPRDPKLHESTV